MITLHHENSSSNSSKLYLLDETGREEYHEYVTFSLEDREIGIMERKLGMYLHEYTQLRLNQHMYYSHAYSLLIYEHML